MAGEGKSHCLVVPYYRKSSTPTKSVAKLPPKHEGKRHSTPTMPKNVAWPLRCFLIACKAKLNVLFLIIGVITRDISTNPVSPAYFLADHPVRLKAVPLLPNIRCEERLGGQTCHKFVFICFRYSEFLRKRFWIIKQREVYAGHMPELKLERGVLAIDKMAALLAFAMVTSS